MSKYKKIIFLCFSILLLLSFACRLPQGSTGTGLTNQETIIAQTVEARLTEAMLNTFVAALTQSPLPGSLPSVTSPANLPSPIESPTTPPTHTAQPPTPTVVIPTMTPIPTFTPLPPSPTPIPCNRAQFVADVTYPDNTSINANTPFTKVWRLRNNGACTWTPDYQLIFSSGNQMSGASAVNINATVPPNQTVDVAVNLISPSAPGTYTGYWMLRTPTGIIFGIGKNADTAFWVKIKVSQPTATFDPNILMDFAQYYCYAQWTNSNGNIIPCPSPGYDFNIGSITSTSAPVIETAYQDDEITIVTIPNNAPSGFISGRYPPVKVIAGDRFQALLGCLAASPSCNVTFNLKYSADGGPIQSLGSWVETFDGNRTPVDIDLNALAGKSVEFILEVQNNGSSVDDRAFWMVPKIKR